MTPNEQRKYDENMTKLENVLGKEELARLTIQLVARHGDKLEGVLLSALTHLDKNYNVDAVGELLEDGQMVDIDRINHWANEGEKPQLEFDSMKSESGVEPKKDQGYDGFAFESMNEDGE